MTDILILAVVTAAVGLAVRYIYKEKKRGSACIGCPSGGCGECHCNCHNE